MGGFIVSVPACVLVLTSSPRQVRGRFAAIKNGRFAVGRWDDATRRGGSRLSTRWTFGYVFSRWHCRRSCTWTGCVLQGYRARSARRDPTGPPCPPQTATATATAYSATSPVQARVFVVRQPFVLVRAVLFCVLHHSTFRRCTRPCLPGRLESSWWGGSAVSGGRGGGGRRRSWGWGRDPEREQS